MTAHDPDESAALQLTDDLHGAVWALAATVVHDVDSGGSTDVVAAGDSDGTVTWWDAATGEVLGTARTADSGVVRALVALTPPDHRVLFAVADNNGTVQLWRGVGEPSSVAKIWFGPGPVWSMTALAAFGRPLVLFTGGDRGRIRCWDVETGEPLGEPFGDHHGPVRAMVAGPPVDGRPTVFTGGDDGTVRRWDAETGERLGSPLSSGPGAVWGMAVATTPSGRVIVASCSNAGLLCRWDDTGVPLGEPVEVGGGALSAVVPITLRDGRVALVCAGTNGGLSCWDVATGEAVGRPERPTGRGINSLTTMTGADGRVRLVSGTDGSVTVAPVPWENVVERSLRAPAQVDSTHCPDGLGRRVLAEHLEALLSELAAHSESTSAVVHVDGVWGAGKSTLVRLLLDDEQEHGPDWSPPLVVDYEAWRESAIGPEWWSLSAAIARKVRRSRRRITRLFLLVWSLVRQAKRSPALLTAAAFLISSGVAMLLVPSAWFQNVGAVVAVLGLVVGIGQTLGRALFWYAAPFGRLHLQTGDNPLGQVADMIGWLRGWSPRSTTDRRRRRPILLVVDDLDRCSAERVVKLLETVHTMLRHQPYGRRHRPAPARLLVLVLADGRWVRQAFASRFAEFQNLGCATLDLGSDFTQKVFDHVVLVPDLFADQVAPYLDRMVGPRPDGPPDARGAPPGRTTTTAVAPAGPSPQKERGADPAPTADGGSDVARTRWEAAVAATTTRSEYLLHGYVGLMPANPRMIKRIVNALRMLEAIKGHVRHGEGDDAMARAAILLVRFPALAGRLRTDALPDDGDPCWHLPEVRAVRGDCSAVSLARCLGRPVAHAAAFSGSADAGSPPRSPDPA